MFGPTTPPDVSDAERIPLPPWEGQRIENGVRCLFFPADACPPLAHENPMFTTFTASRATPSLKSTQM
jgi:hypothetical protein